MVIGALLICVGLVLAFFSGEFGRAARVAFVVGALLALLGVGFVAADLFDLDTADARSSWSFRSSWSALVARFGS